MKTNIIGVIFLYLLTILVACNSEKEQIKIDYPNITKLNVECRNIAKAYFPLYNTDISNFYKITDSLNVDFNEDKLIDKLVVIRPVSLLLDDGKCFDTSGIDKPILLVFENKNGKYFLTNKFDNLFCSIDPTILNQEITNYSNGFKLIGDYGMGNGRKVYYNIYISNNNNKFIIDSINYVESMTSKPFSKKIDFTKKKLLLDNYNRNFICDSLR